MKKQLLATLPVDDLAERFETLCIAQYHSLEREEIAIFNRRYKEIKIIVDELKSRSGDQRRILLKFLGHPNLQVRLAAAHANLATDYNRARAVFEDVAENAFGIPKLDAGMTLWNLDRGVYRPT